MASLIAAPAQHGGIFTVADGDRITSALQTSSGAGIDLKRQYRVSAPPIMPIYPPLQHRAYRPDIDGLRAVAVLSVVLFHAGIPGFSGGFIGVDIFFVISGFLITGIVWSELGAGTFSLQDFYVRRIKRIFPALFAMLLVSSIAAFVLLIPSDLVKFSKTLNAALFFNSNFYWHDHLEYFDAPAIDNPLLHCWSLAVEEQFYALWPLLLLASRRFLPDKPGYVIAALALASLVLAEAALPDYQKDAFYYPWCRMWELLIGAALAIHPLRSLSGPVATLAAATGLAAITLATVLYGPSTSFPGLAALLPCGGAALIIAAGSPSNLISRLLGSEPMRRIGLISYSLYLIHWPVFSFAHLYFAGELPAAVRLGLVLLSVAMAFVSWRFVEMPFRKSRPATRTLVGAAAACMTFLCLTGYAFSGSGGFPFRAGARLQEVEVQGWSLPQYCRAISFSKITRNIACEFGEARGGQYDFVLWGDSHARHFLPAIATLAKERKLSGVLFSRAGCPPFLGDPRSSRECQDFNASVAAWISKRSLAFAVLGGRWISGSGYVSQLSSEKSPASNRSGLAPTLGFLSERKLAVTVLDQMPDFPQEIGSCVARRLYFGQDFRTCTAMPAKAFEARHLVLSEYFAFLHKAYDFSVADASGLICGAQECQAYDGTQLLMGDTHHLTESGALRTIPYLHIPGLTALQAKGSSADGGKSAVEFIANRK